MTALFTHLGGTPGAGWPRRWAPQTSLRQARSSPLAARPADSDLPAGWRRTRLECVSRPASTLPPSRYYTGYGLGNPHIMTGPWSRIVAYDLNRRHDQVAGAARSRQAGGRAGRRRRRRAARLAAHGNDRDVHRAALRDREGRQGARALRRRREHPLDRQSCRTAPRDCPRCTKSTAVSTSSSARRPGLTWGPKSREGGAVDAGRH